MELQGAALVERLRADLSGSQLSRERRVELRCQLAKELEASGDLEEAREALGDLWRGVGERPAVEGLAPRPAAELLMRVGTLSGRFGKGKGIEGAQEQAIDLISEAARIFEQLGDGVKRAEAWTEIGFCYWQKGEYGEGRIALDTALDLLGAERGEVWALAVVRKALLENSAGRHYEAYKLLREAGGALAALGRHYTSGRYHIAFANVLFYLSGNEAQARAALDETGQESFADRAFVEYEAAAFHFEQAGHSRHAARVLNNTAYLLFTRGRFEEAHENLDRARAIFRDLRERGSVAQVDETRARVYLAEGKDEAAEAAAGGAVAVLEQGDDAAQLAQALATHGRALARLGRYAEAKHALERARTTGETCGDREAAGQACLTMIEEMADVLPAYDVLSLYEAADELLAETQRPETITRLRACARLTFMIVRRALRTDLEDGWTGCNLEDEVLRYERELILQAMAAEGGHITRAARRLQTTHQNLRNIINGRQRKYLGHRYAPRARRPSNGTQDTSDQVATS